MSVVHVCDGCRRAKALVLHCAGAEGAESLDYCEGCAKSLADFRAATQAIYAKVRDELNELRNVKFAHLKTVPAPQVFD